MKEDPILVCIQAFAMVKENKKPISMMSEPLVRGVNKRKRQHWGFPYAV